MSEIPIPTTLHKALLSFLNQRMERDRFLQQQCFLMDGLRAAARKAEKPEIENAEHYLEICGLFDPSGGER